MVLPPLSSPEKAQLKFLMTISAIKCAGNSTPQQLFSSLKPFYRRILHAVDLRKPFLSYHTLYIICTLPPTISHKLSLPPLPYNHRLDIYLRPSGVIHNLRATNEPAGVLLGNVSDTEGSVQQ